MTRKKRWFWSFCFAVAALFLPMGSLAVPAPSSSGIPVQAEETRLTIDQDKRLVQENANPVTDLYSTFRARITRSTFSDTCQSYTINLSLYADYDIIDLTFGYYGTEELYLPLMAQYMVITEDGETLSRSSEIPPVRTSNRIPYQALGSTFDESLNINIDLLLNPGEKVEEGSLLLYNIFPIARSEEVDPETNTRPFVPDTTQPYYIDNFTFSSQGQNNIDLSQYISASFKGISTFAGYTSFTVQFHNNTEELYHQEMAGSTNYEDNMKRIERGDYRFNYSFSGLTTAFLLLAYEDNSMIQLRVLDGTLTSTIGIGPGDTTVRFLSNKVDLEGLTGLSLCSSNFTIGIVNVDTLADIKTANYSTRFGAIYFEPAGDMIENVSRTDINLILILVFIIGTLVYAGIAVFFFFYLSKKYRNDEFRRMNAKEYIKTHVIGYLAVMVVLFDILFISFRAASLGNELAQFNPLDNLIVAFSILAILFIGYFVKFFYHMIKDYLERRTSQRLHLDSDSSDDGTK